MEQNTSQKEIQLQLPLVPIKEKTDWKAEVPSVSQLTRRIRGHIENAFFDVWVRGEISNFRKPGSGHGYFILKDEKSQLRSVIFRGQLSKHRFQIQDGMEVLLHGVISVYEARGEYQIICDRIEPVGVGALQLAFEQLKIKLQKEGLFDKAHKKPTPFLPSRIGVVTSATGAAVRDIIKVLSRRFVNREIMLIPAAVQGKKAAEEICNALSQAEKWNTVHPEKAIEVLIVGRGGGSLEDLWPFNEEIVARKIYACPIPIISAVGHEIDFTIADFVADLRAPTPSAAAEIVVPSKEELLIRVKYPTQRLYSNLHKSLQQLKLHVGHLTQRLIDPRERIKKFRETFQQVSHRLYSAMKTRLELSRNKLESAAQMLHSLSPLQVLGRGYSITRTDKGKLIKSIKNLKEGTALTHLVSDGTIESRVISLKPSPVMTP